MSGNLTPTLQQRATIAMLKARIDAAKALHSSPWRTARIRRLRARLTRIAKTKDSIWIGQWLHEWKDAVESECRFLEDAAPVDWRALVSPAEHFGFEMAEAAE